MRWQIDLINNRALIKYYMKKLDRREFLTKAAIGTGAALALSQLPAELFANAAFYDMPIGFQSCLSFFSSTLPS